METAWEEHVGALHVHTRYSDGTADIRRVAEHAGEAGLNFLVVSDHDTLAAKREGWEGEHDGVTLLVAAEITPRRRGHVLACRVDTCSGYAVRPHHENLTAIQEQGGFAVVAHPQGKRKPWLRIDQVPWFEWDHPCLRGLEIWSYTHDWIEDVTWWRAPWAHSYYAHPERHVRGPEPGILRYWDRLGQTRRLSGLAGLDCHARWAPLAHVVVFPYERMFRWLRNHCFIPAGLTGGARVAALWSALEEGRVFVAHDILADSAGTTCFARLPCGRRIAMGEEAEFAPGIAMELRLPRAAEVRWICDGVCRLRGETDRMTAHPLAPGVYRFEAWIDRRPWIFTNAFYLRTAASVGAAARDS